MEEKRWTVLIVGDLPEADDAFSAPCLTDRFETRADYCREPDRLEEYLEAKAYDLIIIDLPEACPAALETIHKRIPTVPVLMIGDLGCPERTLECKREGLDNYVFRLPEPDVFANLLAEELVTMLRRFAEPPDTVRPTATDLQRYAQYYNVLQPFFVIDRHHRLRYVNDAGDAFLQAIRAGPVQIGQPVDDWPLEAGPQAFRDHLERAIDGEPTVSHHTFEETPSGSGFRELFYQPVRDRTGRVIAVSLAIYVPSHPELEKARRLQTVGRLSAGVAHDFNNLLGIVGTCSALIRSQVPEIAEEHAEFLERNLDQIDRTVERGADLTHQLLSFSRRDAAEVRPLDLEEIVDNLEPLVENLVEEDIEVHMDCAEDLPAVRADRSQLEQVVMNLVANARDAMPTGGTLHVETDVVEVASENPPAPEMVDGPFVRITVTDTGAGIGEDELSRIFEPFYTTKGGNGGTGLGLATVREIVDGLGGAVDVSSELGHGTTFRIYLPAVRVDVSETEDEPGPNRLDPSVIWLVEDEAELRKSLGELLEMQGHEVVTAADYDEAIAIADDASGPPDIVISDVVMPGKSGFELADELSERWPDLPIVLLSGYSTEALNRYGDLSRDDFRFLNKPLTPAKLFSTLDELIEVEAS